LSTNGTTANDRRTVVVTGVGATTPVGGDAPSTWQALLSGQSGVRTLTEEWASELPVTFAAAIAVEPTEVLDRLRP
jgi:3-oxoacyl-[acyl-carrier-protein] synthase II